MKFTGDGHQNRTIHSIDKNCNNQRYFNMSDSIRMENDLRGWIQRVRKQKIQENQKIFKQKAKNLGGKKSMLHPLKRIKSSFIDYPKYNDRDLLDQVLLKHKMDLLLDAIHRRDDTYYFVSFSLSALDHHLLLPASESVTGLAAPGLKSLNSTSGKNMTTHVRPRFSIVMPALNTEVNQTSVTGINSTFNILTLMQIDCEVINTRMVHVRDLQPSGPETEGPKNTEGILSS